MTPPEAAPYETLARILERELEAVGSGELEAFGELSTQREALILSLPPVPPASARPALERAALTQKRVEIEIIRRREAIVLELAQAERVRRVANGYAPPRATRASVYADA
jgi:hypothetical protein